MLTGGFTRMGDVFRHIEADAPGPDDGHLVADRRPLENCIKSTGLDIYIN